MAAGTSLCVGLPEPARVRYGINGWTGAADVATRDCGLGMHVADLPVAQLPPGSTVEFTFQWTASQRWDDRDSRVVIA